MFPFEQKGDFAEVGRFIVNVFGSAIYLFKALLIGFLFYVFGYRQPAGRTRLAVFFVAALATPFVVLAIHGIVHPKVAAQRTLSAYAAAPQLAAHVLGFDVE